MPHTEKTVRSHPLGQRRVIRAAAVGIAIIGCVVTLSVLLQPNEPMHAGKPLSFWLGQLDAKQARDADSPAALAIQAIGTNALPRFTAMLHSHEPRWRTWVRDYLPAGSLLVKPPSQGVQASYALACLRLSAVPALERAMSESGDLVGVAAVTLGRTCPAGAPALAHGLTNADWEVRLWCARVLGAVGNWNDEGGYEDRVRATAVLVVPTLLEAIHDTNSAVAVEAVNALAKLGNQPETIVPVLATVHTNQNVSPDIRGAAARALVVLNARQRPQNSTP